MRVCVFASELNDDLSEPEAWLVRRYPSLHSVKREDVYIVSYRLPGTKRTTSNVYFPWEQSSFKHSLSRRILLAIERCAWIPILLSLIPLQIVGEAYAELILACDPDVVILSEIRWAKCMARALQARFPQWTFLTQAGQEIGRPAAPRHCDTSVKVSIVLPTYNGVTYIRRSIESCLNQSFANLELIVVDDGSKEDIASIVGEYSDPRLHYVRHEQNRGIAEGLNTGFERAVGNYLTWTSDDNYYAPNAIQEMVSFLQTYPQVDFVYAENYIVNEGNTTWKGGAVRRNEPPESLAVDNFVGACFLYTRKVYEVTGRYNPKTFLAEDYDYWVRVSGRFKMQRLFRQLYYYRFHKNSLTSKASAEDVRDKVKLVKGMNRIG